MSNSYTFPKEENPIHKDETFIKVKDLMKGLSVNKVEKILFEVISSCREGSEVL
jgi:hypothetical protein